MRYPFSVKGLPGFSPVWSLAIVLFLAFLAPQIIGKAEARSSFWISDRDKNACIVSAVVQYDPKLEARVQKENGIGNAILQMDLHTKEPQELCTMLMMKQDDRLWRPLLCVTRIRGNIYSGYLVLPPEFSLQFPIEISLGSRTIEAGFVK